jgi:hypothetical protein
LCYVPYCVAIGAVLGLGTPHPIILLITAGIKALEGSPQMVEGLALKIDRL